MTEKTRVCDLCGRHVRAQGYGGHLFIVHGIRRQSAATLAPKTSEKQAITVGKQLADFGVALSQMLTSPELLKLMTPEHKIGEMPETKFWTELRRIVREELGKTLQDSVSIVLQAQKLKSKEP